VAQVVTYELELVCTDRGQHPERPIGTLLDRRQPNPLPVEEHMKALGHFDGIRKREVKSDAEYRVIAEKQYLAATHVLFREHSIRRTSSGDARLTSRTTSIQVGSIGSGRLFTFACETCKRAPRRDEDWIVQLVEGYTAAGELRFDISTID
jgi:hypothetical protein